MGRIRKIPAYKWGSVYDVFSFGSSSGNFKGIITGIRKLSSQQAMPGFEIALDELWTRQSFS